MTTHAAGYEGAELHLYTRAAAKIDHQIFACHRCACGIKNYATRKKCRACASIAASQENMPQSGVWPASPQIGGAAAEDTAGNEAFF